MAQRSVRPTVRWATAAATLTFLPPSTIAASGGVFERRVSQPSEVVGESTSSAVVPDPHFSHDSKPAESSAGARPLALGTRVLFVAGPSNVRFRIDLRSGRLSTPNVPKLLERVVDVVVGERLLLLCQVESSVGSALNIVGFDLETGLRVRNAIPKAGIASIDATFCTNAQQRQRGARSQVSRYMQNI